MPMMCSQGSHFKVTVLKFIEAIVLYKLLQAAGAVAAGPPRVRAGISLPIVPDIKPAPTSGQGHGTKLMESVRNDAVVWHGTQHVLSIQANPHHLKHTKFNHRRQAKAQQRSRRPRSDPTPGCRHATCHYNFTTSPCSNSDRNTSNSTSEQDFTLKPLYPFTTANATHSRHQQPQSGIFTLPVSQGTRASSSKHRAILMLYVTAAAAYSPLALCSCNPAASTQAMLFVKSCRPDDGLELLGHTCVCRPGQKLHPVLSASSNTPLNCYLSTFTMWLLLPAPCIQRLLKQELPRLHELHSTENRKSCSGAGLQVMGQPQDC